MSSTAVFLMGDEPVAVRGEKMSAISRAAMRRAFASFVVLLGFFFF